MSQSERVADLRKRYPALIADIEKAVEITIEGRDGNPYRKNLFSFGDLGHSVTAELMREINHGLAEKIKKWQGQFDYLVALNPGGGAWGLPLALKCRADLVIGWVNRGGSLYEPTWEDEFRVQVAGPHGRQLCFRGMERGDRVVIVDDVISSGQTVKGVVKALQERGVKIMGILAIVTKGNGHRDIEQEFGVPVVSLIDLDEEGKFSQS